MKVVISEDSLEFEPETEHEKQALNKIKRNQIEPISFKDQWNEKFPLVIKFKKDDWK